MTRRQITRLFTVFSAATATFAIASMTSLSTSARAGDSDIQVSATPGDLDFKNYQAQIQAGFTNDNHNEMGGSVKLDLQKDYFLNPSHNYDNTGAIGFVVEPGLHVQADVVEPTSGGKVGLKTLNIELSGVSAVRFSEESSTHSAEGNHTKAEADEAKSAGKTVKLDHYTTCGELSADVQKAARCFEGMPEDPSTWTDKQKTEANHRAVPIYSIEEKSSTGGQFTFLEATGVYNDNSALQVKTVAARITGVRTDAATSFKINNAVQFDFCMGLSAGMLLGSLQNNGTTAPAAGDFHGHACAGIKLGQIARLGYELDAGLQFSTDSTSVLNVTHTASISQIFNTPLFINAKRESDWTYGSTGSQNNGITANFLSAGATF